MGLLLVADPVVSAIVVGLERIAFAGKLNAVDAGPFGIGISNDSLVQCETAHRSD